MKWSAGFRGPDTLNGPLGERIFQDCGLRGAGEFRKEADLMNDILVAKDQTVYAATTLGQAWSTDHGDTWQFIRGADWIDKVKNRLGGPPQGWQPPTDADNGGGILAEDYCTALAEDADGRLLVGHRAVAGDILEWQGQNALVGAGAAASARGDLKKTDALPNEYITGFVPADVGRGAYLGGYRPVDPRCTHWPIIRVAETASEKRCDSPKEIPMPLFNRLSAGAFFCVAMVWCSATPAATTPTPEPNYSGEKSALRAVEDSVIHGSWKRPASLEILPGDDLNIAFAKTRQSLLDFSLSKLEERADYAKKFAAIARAASQKFPGVTELTVLRAYSALYGQSDTEALRAIVPVTADWPDCPGVTIVMCRTLDSMYTNASFALSLQKQQGLPIGDVETNIFVDAGDPWKDSEDKCRALLKLWVPRLDPAATARVLTPQLQDVVKGPATQDDTKLAAEAWLEVLANVEAYETREQRAQHLREQESAENQKVAQEGARAKEAEDDAIKSVVRGFSVFETKSASNVDFEEQMAKAVGGFRKELAERYPHVPNLVAIEKAFPGSEEPEVVDIYYRFVINPKAPDILPAINGLKTADTDVRLLYLRAYIAHDSGQPEEARQILARILSLDPKQYKAKYFLLRLDEEKEKGSQAAPSPGN